jgi:hypothetical protein
MLPPDVCAFEEASFRSKSRNSGERRYRIVLSILILSMTIVNGTVGELGRPSLIAVNHTILNAVGYSDMDLDNKEYLRVESRSV